MIKKVGHQKLSIKLIDQLPSDTGSSQIHPTQYDVLNRRSVNLLQALPPSG